MSRKICIRPGKATIDEDTHMLVGLESAAYYDFSIQYSLDKLIDIGEDTSKINNIFAALHYGAKAMSEYDKSGNYITEIIVNN